MATKAPAKKTTATKPPAKTTAATKAPAKKVAAKIPAAKKTATPRGRAQDRKLIAGEQAYEVRDVAGKTGHSIEEVKAAIEALGHSRAEIVKALMKGDAL